MRYSDIIVVGAGMAGLMAAITAAKAGKSVSVLSEGAGVLSIGSGAVDFLGYVDGKKIMDSPYNHLKELPKNHPYNIAGESNIKDAFASLIEISGNNGYKIKISDDGCNQTAISIVGTTKPTYICSDSNNASRILKAKKILFAGVEYLKDAQVALAVKQAKHYKVFAEAELNYAMLPSPFGKTHRVLNCLDIARYVDKEEGFNWLKSELLKCSAGYDAVIIPPICGTVNYIKNYEALKNEGLSIVESLSIPPGVGGYRLRDALMKGQIYHHLQEQITDFLVETTLSTADFFMDPFTKKENVIKFLRNVNIIQPDEKIMMIGDGMSDFMVYKNHTADYFLNFAVNENRKLKKHRIADDPNFIICRKSAEIDEFITTIE